MFFIGRGATSPHVPAAKIVYAKLKTYIQVWDNDSNSWKHLLTVWARQTPHHRHLCAGCMELFSKGGVTKAELVKVRDLQLLEWGEQ